MSQQVLTLKFIDGSSKECEVTGRMMGGDDCFYMPLSSVPLGRIKWDTDRDINMNHFVNVVEKGEDYLVVEVFDWRGNKQGSTLTLTAGTQKSYGYYFGEWEYHYSVELLWKS